MLYFLDISYQAMIMINELGERHLQVILLPVHSLGMETKLG